MPDLLPIAIVEDQALFRSMLRTSLSAQGGIRVAMAAGSAAEARQAFVVGSIRVAILDVGLTDGNGIDLGIELRRLDPHLRILLLSAQNAMDAIADLPPDVSRGWSYLSKTSTANVTTLARAVRATAQGMTVLDPGLVASSVPSRGSTLSRLTKRQYEILQQVALGLSNQSIADHFGIAARSVHNHLTGIYAALGIEQNGQENQRVTAVLRFISESRQR